MPRRISAKEASSFLYMCLKNSVYENVTAMACTVLLSSLMMLLQIDFTKVGDATNLPGKSI